MSLTRWWIAWRYLRSKKSHGAVSAIAAVSVAGVAIATAAVVVVLSVFNGFKEVLSDRFDIMTPDIVVEPVYGKVFANADSVMEVAASVGGVETVMPVVSDKALAVFEGRELPVTLKGVDMDKYSRVTSIKDILMKGGRMPSDYYEAMPEAFDNYEDYEAYMEKAQVPEVLPSIGAAMRLGGAMADDSFIIFAPRREGRYNPANPLASFVTDSVRISGVYQSRQKEYDEDMVVVPIGMARHLFQYEDEATGLEIKVGKGSDASAVKAAVAQKLGKEFRVKDRMEMQEVNFRMINIEKWVSYLLLFFILVIATFNIVSTMTMLVLEKRRPMAILNSLGMSRGGVAGVFRNESVLVSLLGGVIGIALGVGLCLLQEHYGLIKLAGDPATLLMTVYPVRIIWWDVLLAFLPSVVLGFGTALVAGAFAKSRISSNPVPV